MKKTDIKIGDLYQVNMTHMSTTEKADLDGASNWDHKVGRVIREGVTQVSFSEQEGWSKIEYDGETAWVSTGQNYRYGYRQSPGWLVEIVDHPFDLAKAMPACVQPYSGTGEDPKPERRHWTVVQSRDILRPWSQAVADKMIAERQRRSAASRDQASERERIGQAERHARESVIDLLMDAPPELVRQLPYEFGTSATLPSLTERYGHEVKIRWTTLLAILKQVQS